MMHKAWRSIEEVPYCISRSSIKFHGHTVGKIEDLNPIWDYSAGRSYQIPQICLVFNSVTLKFDEWPWKTNRAPLLSNTKLYASFHHHLWIQTGLTVRKRLSWVLTSVTLTFDLWPWPFACTSLLSMVITPENFMMILWQEHSEKGVTDGQTDRTIHRAAWSQLKRTKTK